MKDRASERIEFINLNEHTHDLFEITRLHGLFGSDVPGAD